MLLLAPPAADAAVTVSMAVKPEETTYGDPTQITGTALQDGTPFAGQPVVLEGRRYPFEDEFQALETGTTAADGAYAFAPSSTATGTCACARATVCRRARNSRVIRVTQRYRVPRDVKLEKPTIFYVGRRGAKRIPRAAVGEVERVRAGRYRSTALVRLPAKWHGRFRYASCFRHTAGSGMGNPRAGCPRRFTF